MRRPAIAVIQNIDTGGVGYFGQFAAGQGLPLQVFHPYAGDALPRDMGAFSGLCVLGGPMSANDDIAYLRQVEGLIRDAVGDDKPVIGHCLGGQLMARAFGASVERAPVPEIGWLEMEATASTHAEWFGAERFTLYHWHHESFALPPGAVHLARSRWCETQAYALGERHIGMQFHCEITPQIIDDWLAEQACQRDIARHAPRHESVQDEATMRAYTARHSAASFGTAQAIYSRWARHLA